MNNKAICIGHCAKPNNRDLRRPKLSAIDVTEKAIFDCLILVPGQHYLAPFVIMPYVPTPPPLTLQLFLDLKI